MVSFFFIVVAFGCGMLIGRHLFPLQERQSKQNSAVETEPIKKVDDLLSEIDARMVRSYSWIDSKYVRDDGLICAVIEPFRGGYRIDYTTVSYSPLANSYSMVQDNSSSLIGLYVNESFAKRAVERHYA